MTNSDGQGSGVQNRNTVSQHSIQFQHHDMDYPRLAYKTCYHTDKTRYHIDSIPCLPHLPPDASLSDPTCTCLCPDRFTSSRLVLEIHTHAHLCFPSPFLLEIFSKQSFFLPFSHTYQQGKLVGQFRRLILCELPQEFLFSSMIQAHSNQLRYHCPGHTISTGFVSLLMASNYVKTTCSFITYSTYP